MRKKDSSSIVLGLILILAGVWTLLTQLGYAWARMDRLWPLVVITVGLLAMVNGLRREPRDPGGVWFGLTAALCGGLFLYITIGQGEWGDLNYLWPVFPAAAGVAWVAAWLVDWRQFSNMVSGLIAVAVGVLGFMYTYDYIDAEIGEEIISFWPLILIAIGVGLVVQFLAQRRRD